MTKSLRFWYLRPQLTTEISVIDATFDHICLRGIGIMVIWTNCYLHFVERPSSVCYENLELAVIKAKREAVLNWDNRDKILTNHYHIVKNIFAVFSHVFNFRLGCPRDFFCEYPHNNVIKCAAGYIFM